MVTGQGGERGRNQRDDIRESGDRSRKISLNLLTVLDAPERKTTGAGSIASRGGGGNASFKNRRRSEVE